MKKTDLDSLIAQAQRVTPPEPDWERMEGELFRRIDAAEEAEPLAPRARSKAWVGAAVGLSLAAGVALLLGPWNGARTGGDRDDGARATGAPAKEQPAGTFLGTLGRDGTSPVPGAVVTVGGQPIEVGRELVRNDVVETKGAAAVFERAQKVTFAVDDESKVGVDRAPGSRGVGGPLELPGDGPIVVTLESGAIEADVVPVKNGEAFAVDIPVRSPSGVVQRARVAVHGTHLRVMRAGSLVTVDLTEGVVSIGRPPRTGSTYGTLVTAPAHVEFDAARLETLTVSHDEKDVRKRVALKVAAAADTRTGALAWKADPEPAEPPPAPADVKGRPARATTPAVPEKPSIQEDAKPVVDPRTSIVHAVKACALSRMQAASVKITLTTTLSMTVGPDGKVRTATFAPPLDPGTQECAARTIYASDFGADQADSRPVSLVVEVSSK